MFRKHRCVELLNCRCDIMFWKMLLVLLVIASGNPNVLMSLLLYFLRRPKMLVELASWPGFLEGLDAIENSRWLSNIALNCMVFNCLENIIVWGSSFVLKPLYQLWRCHCDNTLGGSECIAGIIVIQCTSLIPQQNWWYQWYVPCSSKLSHEWVPLRVQLCCRLIMK